MILNLIKDYKFIKAKKKLEDYLIKFPNQYDFVLKICKTYQDLKKKKQFYYFAKILYSEFPNKIDSYAIYAQALFNNRQYKTADKILKEAFDILDNPKNDRTKLFLSQIL